MRRKITLIGAGSVVFAKKLIGDILQFPKLSDSEICLMDIDPQRLKVAEVMTQRTIGALETNATVSATTNRTEAIRDAHYVICTIQVGGYKPSTVVDFAIPARYGLLQTIGDTLGVGGVFRALRTIPPLLEVARDIADEAHPDCLFLNYSNPMAMNCWAVDRATGIPHVGLCHSVQGTSRNLADYAGLDYAEVTYKVAGINHMAFFLEFNHKGQDAYPLLFKALEDPAIVAQDKVRFEMMRRLGYFVTESSEHQSEYVPYFIHHGEKVIDEFLIPIDEYRRRCEAIIATWQQEERNLLGEGEGKTFEVAPQSYEYGSYIIHARESNEPTEIYGNVPNRNLITNLPHGCCVEVPIQVDANGLQPTGIGHLPPQLASICRTNINVQELTVEAALTQKREHIYHAVMMDPHTAATLTLDKIWAMCDEMIEAHQKDGYMGEFTPVIKNTGRGFKGTGDRVIAQLEIEEEFSFNTGSSNRLNLIVENPGSNTLNTTFEITPSNPSLNIQSVDISLESHSRKYFEVAAKVDKTINDPVELEVYTPNPDILCRGIKLIPRSKLAPNENGQSRIELFLGGELAASGLLSRRNQDLLIDITINDADVLPAQSSVLGVMAGSAIELSLAADDRAEIRTINLIPGKSEEGTSAALFNTLGKPIQAGSIEQSTNTASYAIKGQIPLSIFGISKEATSALIEIRVSINALSEGHGHPGGSTSLSGQDGRKCSLPYFHKITIEEPIAR